MFNNLPIYYLGFWDVPQTFYLEYKNTLLYFCRDFNDEIDDYESFYKVYKVDGVSIKDAVRPDPPFDSCKMLILPDFKNDTPIGKINVDDVKFDFTKRKSINAKILKSLNLMSQSTNE